MRINIPDDIARTLGGTERAVKETIAVALYLAGKVSLAKGARLVGIDRVAFQQALTRHGVPLSYSRASAEEDVRAAQRVISDPPPV